MVISPQHQLGDFNRVIGEAHADGMKAPEPRLEQQTPRKPIVKRKAVTSVKNMTQHMNLSRQFSASNVLSGIYNKELEQVT